MVGIKRDRFQWVLYVFFLGLVFFMLYPFWHTMMGSIMSYDEYLRRPILIWVAEPTLENYIHIFTKGDIISPMRVTVMITIIGTLTSVIFTAYAAYGLSKRFPFSYAIMVLIVITMFVNPGLIPRYMVMKRLGLLNTYLVYLLPFPALCNTFNLIVMRTYFGAFSHEVEESALMDGCSHFGVFFRIVLPLSKPILATIGLFYAVQFWNTFFQSLFFVTDENKQTLQHYLFTIVKAFFRESELERAQEFGPDDRLTIQTLKLANVMVTVIPIIVVYPFLQKYFVKGIMIGSVKG
jgi:ABC-type glycerol-3-phosphate transport system permease component